MRRIMTEVIVIVMLTAGMIYGSYTGNITTDVSSIQTLLQNGYDVVLVEDGNGFTKEIGNPHLPVKTLSYLIPLESSVESVTINSTKVEILNSKEYNVYPTQPPLKTGDGDNVEFVEPNEDVYSSGLLYPEKICGVISEEYRFGYHIVTIEFYPVQYDTGSKELKVHTDINFTLNYTGSKQSYVLPETQSEKVYEMTKNMIMVQVENPDDMAFLSGGAKNVIEETNVVKTRKVNKSMPLPAFETPEYIIITSEDLKPEFQKLAEWKTKKGVPTIIVDLEDIAANYTGDLKEKIRTYLSEQYIKFGVFYVLLGGDVNIIPTAPDNTTPWKIMKYDTYYMDVVNDTGLELLVGRASVEDVDYTRKAGQNAKTNLNLR